VRPGPLCRRIRWRDELRDNIAGRTPSALAGKLLKDMGYEKVYNVGGFKDWTGEVEK
jgi:hypothetical protein